MTLTDEQRIAFLFCRFHRDDMTDDIRQEMFRELDDPDSRLSELSREETEFARKLRSGEPGLLDLEAMLELVSKELSD